MSLLTRSSFAIRREQRLDPYLVFSRPSPRMAEAELEIAELFDDIGAAELEELEGSDEAEPAEETPAEDEVTS